MTTAPERNRVLYSKGQVIASKIPVTWIIALFEGDTKKSLELAQQLEETLFPLENDDDDDDNQSTRMRNEGEMNQQQQQAHAASKSQRLKQLLKSLPSTPHRVCDSSLNGNNQHDQIPFSGEEDYMHLLHPNMLPDPIRRFVHQLLKKRQGQRRRVTKNDDGGSSAIIVIICLYLYAVGGHRNFVQSKHLDDEGDNYHGEDSAADVEQDHGILAVSWRRFFAHGIAACDAAVDDDDKNIPTISWPDWSRLYRAVQHQVHFVTVDHPLRSWARQVLPLLSTRQGQSMMKRLSLQQLQNPAPALPEIDDSMAVAGQGDENQNKAPSSVLALIEYFEQHYATPQEYAVFLAPTNRDGSGCLNLQHSCWPDAAFELDMSSTPRLSLVALHDFAVTAHDNIDDVSSAVITVRRIPAAAPADTDLDSRQAAVWQHTGSACICLVCRYEMQFINTSELTPQQATQLAHYYFVVHHQYDTAQRLYQHAMRLLDPQTKALPIPVPKPQQQDKMTMLAQQQQHQDEHKQSNQWMRWDVSHALGALQLTQGRFLDAQRIWYDAAVQMTSDPTLSSRCSTSFTAPFQQHTGLALQLAKIQAYGYLQPPPPERDVVREEPTWHSPIRHVFITSLLDCATCQQVIAWADESAGWTQQRHYAVPTTDIPIHTVPTLLSWFQNDFMMHHQIRSLLARQFGTSNNYYVHDAFCVKYQGTTATSTPSKNTYLPIHTDESSHSLVIALNNDYTGGGTYFADAGLTIHCQTGHMLSFRGDSIRHGGEPVRSGTRYILAVFLYHDNDTAGKATTSRYARSSNNINNNTARIVPTEMETRSGLTFGDVAIKRKGSPRALREVIGDSKRTRTGFSFGFSL